MTHLQYLERYISMRYLKIKYYWKQIVNGAQKCFELLCRQKLKYFNITSLILRLAHKSHFNLADRIILLLFVELFIYPIIISVSMCQ